MHIDRSQFVAPALLIAVFLISGPVVGQTPHAVKISESEGGFGGQLVDKAYFGTSVEVLGDLDGDGVVDLAVGAPGDDKNGEYAGVVWILFLNSDGTVKSEQKITAGEGGLDVDLFDGRQYARFGFKLAKIRDLDGDGSPELVVADKRGTFAGNSSQTWVLFLEHNGEVRDYRIIETFQEAHVAPIGDFNKDGFDDIVWESFGNTGEGGTHGTTFVALLGQDGLIQKKLATRIGLGAEGGAAAGGCEAAGDLDGDGMPELVCADTDRGFAVHHLSGDGVSQSASKYDLEWCCVLQPRGSFDRHGPFFAEGSKRSTILSSIIVGLPIANSWQGAVFRAFLNSSGDVRSIQRIDTTVPGLLEQVEEGSRFGRDVAVADLDGNGLEEIFVGARTDDGEGFDRGAVWIVFNAPLPPPEVLSTEVSVLAAVDEDVRLESHIFDVQGVGEAQLHFRRGGDPSFFSGTMTAADDTTFLFDIPGWVSGPRGIEYHVTATNANGTETRWPKEGSRFIQIQVPEGLSVAAPAGTEVSGYRLVTFPLVLEADDAQSVFEDDLGAYDVKRWRFFAWSPSLKDIRIGVGDPVFNAGSPVEYGSRPISIRPGASYWLLVKDAAQSIGTGTGYSVPTAEPFTIGTAYGWHLIANPFTFDLPVAQVAAVSERTPRSLTDLIESGVVDLVSYDGSEFVDVVDTLRAFNGYALYVRDCLDALTCDPVKTGQLHFYADPKMMSEVSASKKEHAGESWAIRVSGFQGKAKDRFNRAVVSASASQGWDPLDRPEPPAIGDYVSVSFPHPEWGEPSRLFRHDTRPEPTDGDAWPIEVRTRTFDPVELRFEGLDDVPVLFEVWLIDERAGVRKDLREDPTYTLAGPGEEHPAPLSLVVGTEEFILDAYRDARLLPTSAELLPIYPNPFSGTATLRYVLPEASSVQIEVVDVLGRRVRTLGNASSEPAGYNALVWDGRGPDGAHVAGGLYFVRLYLGEDVLTRSVVLTR